ncbi:Oxidase ucsJ [Cladobotryum mycophilum]|uniref:Oxidase ucsJ n=1 Tax=Cladobotryum mycophilum TaxID=491253 RepID=A0ABR0SSM7_9HYPO
MDGKRILLFGITGYVGGQVALHLLQKHPQLNLTAMVRRESQRAAVHTTFPTVHLVLGDLTSVSLLEEECLKADIVVNCATSDDDKAVSVMLETLRSRPHNTFDDVTDIRQITSWPDAHWHRNVDKIVLEAGQDPDSGVKTAILCPPTVYGRGDGPINQRSIQIPELISWSMQRGRVFQVGLGQNIWQYVHVADLADAYVLLIEAAGAERSGHWGQDGYYFVENGSYTSTALSSSIADTLRDMRILQNNGVESLNVDQVQDFVPMGHKMWGTNARGLASRLRGLGWRPSRPHWTTTIRGAVEMELERAQKKEA